MVKVEDIQKLREETGLSVMECKNALEEARGDFEKAKEILKERGFERATQKTDRETENGLIEAYAHYGKIGVLQILIDTSCKG